MAGGRRQLKRWSQNFPLKYSKPAIKQLCIKWNLKCIECLFYLNKPQTYWTLVHHMWWQDQTSYGGTGVVRKATMFFISSGSPLKILMKQEGAETVPVCVEWIFSMLEKACYSSWARKLKGSAGWLWRFWWCLSIIDEMITDEVLCANADTVDQIVNELCHLCIWHWNSSAPMTVPHEGFHKNI